MNPHEIELLTKAHQAAQLLSADLKEVHSNTTCAAVEELMAVAIQQVVGLSRMLGRLSSQR